MIQAKEKEESESRSALRLVQILFSATESTVKTFNSRQKFWPLRSCKPDQSLRLKLGPETWEIKSNTMTIVHLELESSGSSRDYMSVQVVPPSSCRVSAGNTPEQMTWTWIRTQASCEVVSVLNQREERVRFESVAALQLLHLHHHHAAQNLGLLLPHQLTGCQQRPSSSQKIINQ